MIYDGTFFFFALQLISIIEMKFNPDVGIFYSAFKHQSILRVLLFFKRIAGYQKISARRSKIRYPSTRPLAIAWINERSTSFFFFCFFLPWSIQLQYAQ